MEDRDDAPFPDPLHRDTISEESGRLVGLMPGGLGDSEDLAGLRQRDRHDRWVVQQFRWGRSAVRLVRHVLIVPVLPCP